ncbi:uncharacterized protein [Spinacia oleracea]|uniref:Myb/SANT-like domain-containing protein n=1 Tax=Spinacia oleracea TaxID=3562 RepID=A0ABM3QYK2_SPIOL|nr:uncharacterized protein LOC110797686 [Spinacia oleracea]
MESDHGVLTQSPVQMTRELKGMIVGAVAAIIGYVLAFLEVYKSRNRGPRIIRQPYVNRDSLREANINSILYCGDTHCLGQIRMRLAAYFSLCNILVERGLLWECRQMSVKEQVLVFLHLLGHNVRFRAIGGRFFRSTWTIHQYFHIVLKAILRLYTEFVKPPTTTLQPEIQNNPRFFPWFEDFIGAIDGTHFTYVLAGWEGSAHDSKVLGDALRRGFKVPQGKYYMADGGYGDRKGFMHPFRQVRYHLKEYTNNPPENEKELFNLRHSSLRMCVERAFGVLKKRFRVLDAEPFWPFKTQVDVVLACCVIHNYLRGIDPNDPIAREVDMEMNSQDARAPLTRREVREETKECVKKRNAISLVMWTAYKVKKEEKKANFRWSKPMSMVLLEFLAEEVRKGNRPNNSFRTSSFVAAAKNISEVFHTTCTADHVENHMRTVRATWGIISKLRGTSGFGWDDNVKMVTVSPNAFNTYVQQYPTHERYLNHKIDMFEEISIVAGKDMARGDFSKSFADIEVTSIESGQGPTTTIENGPIKSEREVVGALKKFSNNQLDVEMLHEEIMKMEDFDELVRDAAFDHLVEREMLAKAFLTKSESLRRLWLQKFVKSLHS